MRHSDFTGLVPANDNPGDDRQLDLFRTPPVFIGVDLGAEMSIDLSVNWIGDTIVAVGFVDLNGLLVGRAK